MRHTMLPPDPWERCYHPTSGEPFYDYNHATGQTQWLCPPVQQYHPTPYGHPDPHPHLYPHTHPHPVQVPVSVSHPHPVPHTVPVSVSVPHTVPVPVSVQVPHPHQVPHQVPHTVPVQVPVAVSVPHAHHRYHEYSYQRKEDRGQDTAETEESSVPPKQDGPEQADDCLRRAQKEAEDCLRRAQKEAEQRLQHANEQIEDRLRVRVCQFQQDAEEKQKNTLLMHEKVVSSLRKDITNAKTAAKSHRDCLERATNDLLDTTLELEACRLQRDQLRNLSSATIRQFMYARDNVSQLSGRCAKLALLFQFMVNVWALAVVTRCLKDGDTLHRLFRMDPIFSHIVCVAARIARAKAPELFVGESIVGVCITFTNLKEVCTSIQWLLTQPQQTYDGLFAIFQKGYNIAEHSIQVCAIAGNGGCPPEQKNLFPPRSSEKYVGWSSVVRSTGETIETIDEQISEPPVSLLVLASPTGCVCKGDVVTFAIVLLDTVGNVCLSTEPIVLCTHTADGARTVVVHSHAVATNGILWVDVRIGKNFAPTESPTSAETDAATVSAVGSRVRPTKKSKKGKGNKKKKTKKEKGGKPSSSVRAWKAAKMHLFCMSAFLEANTTVRVVSSPFFISE